MSRPPRVTRHPTATPPTREHRIALSGPAVAVAVHDLLGAWLPCIEMHIEGKYLTPCDLGQVPQGTSAWLLPVTPGEYTVTIQVASSSRGAWPIISAVRGLRGASDDSQAVEASMLSVDHGAMTLFDRQPFFRRVPADARDEAADALASLDTRPCVALAGGTAEVLVLPAGEGDGSYPVFVLRTRGTAVGMEIHFRASAT